ncbi:NepR family anti-sigma factor [Methylobacterium adhaesivum]|uniref:NepR family anti-sigma factor n=1 Tax=Methylobacterium adhaesivum TaxID=333297 RepID=A0ABT8BGW8_9HYPH|nr:NepR family anti-sigma factor [Methylobacterium adhaesivum]MDN3590707.1 NepR family anti-sigma factor [Methylobacterium adhaesivum]
MTDHDEGGSPPGERALRAEDDARGRGLSDHTQKRIGLHLRALYDTVVQQPVPDRFRDLIAQLEASPSDETGP